MRDDSAPGRTDPEQSVSATPGSRSAGTPCWPLTGQVVAANGRPLSYYLILVTPVDAPPVPEIAVVSGPDGRFSHLLAPGRYLIQPVPYRQVPYGHERKSGPPIEVTLHPGQVETVTLVVPSSET